MLTPPVRPARMRSIWSGLVSSVRVLNLKINRDRDRADRESFYPRTDAGPFLERGILAIGLTTGTHARYHLPSDEARFLDPGKMEAIARTIYAFAWTLADAAERPKMDKPMPPIVPNYR